MGTSTSWVAVEAVSVEQVACELGLRRAPPEHQGAGPYEAAILPTGWLLLVRRLEADGVVADRTLLEKLSRGRRVVGCDEESHVMYSAAAEWRDGREVWAVIHASEQAADHLVVRGTPPAQWQAVRDAQAANQAAASGDEVDYVYEVPPEVAKLVVGHRTDSEDDDELDFIALVPTAETSTSTSTSTSSPASSPAPASDTPAVKPWWKFW